MLCYKGYRYRGSTTLVYSTDATVHVPYLIVIIHPLITMKYGWKVTMDFFGVQSFFSDLQLKEGVLALDIKSVIVIKKSSYHARRGLKSLLIHL